MENTPFKSYISNRLQYVSYNHCNSTLQNITCGVPQGSILGPLLFFLYINDLGYVSNDLPAFIFADDTSMLIHDKDISSLQSHINDTLEVVSKWLQVNKLSLNVLKSRSTISPFHELNKLSWMKNWPGKIISITYHERSPSVLLTCLSWYLWCVKILWNHCTTLWCIHILLTAILSGVIHILHICLLW